VDHIVPRALGGKDVYSNLQLLHESCHLKKTAADKISIAKARRDKSSSSHDFPKENNYSAKLNNY